jgi:ELWxxDGT repeat protein
MSNRKQTRRFERLENRVLPAFSTEFLGLLGTHDADPQEFVNVNGTMFFRADDGVHGRELWKSNGTAAGTMMLKDINPNIAAAPPQKFVNVNDTLFLLPATAAMALSSGSQTALRRGRFRSRISFLA